MNLLFWYRSLMRSVGATLVKLIATATSGLVSFTTNVIRPVKVTCEFSPVQEGTGDPSPDNVRPISGWTGCEISHAKAIPVDLEVGGFTSLGIEAGDTNRLRSVEFIPVIGGTECSFSFNNKTEDDMVFSCSFYETNEENKARISALSWQTENTFMVPKRANYLRVLIRKTNNAVMQTTFVDNATIIYNPLVASITFTDPSTGDPLTVYGGTITLNEDGSADLVDDRIIVTYDGDEGWGKSGNYYYVRTSYDYKVQQIPVANIFLGVSNRYYQNLADLEFAETQGDMDYINVRYDAIGSLNAFNELLSNTPLVVAYKRRYPQTYHFANIGQLQSFLGENNIWHNMNGGITVEYWNKQ